MTRPTVLFFTAVLSFAAASAQENTSSENREITRLVMVSQLDPATRRDARYVKLLYTAALERLGVTMVFKHYPPARASKLADAGEIDGELSRASHYNDAHPALVRVEEPAFSVRFSAFTISPNIQVSGWDDLDGTTYRVEYRRGSKLAHERLIDRVPAENLTAVSHEKLGLKKLIAGRTDIYIHEEGAVVELLSSEPFRSELKKHGEGKIHRIAILEELTIHAFLHERHRDLAHRLSNELKKMRDEGLFGYYYRMAGSP